MLSYKTIYEQWLNNPDFSEKEKKIITSYTEEEKKKYFKSSYFAFGTAGIRKKMGLNPKQLNVYTYRLLAKGYAEYIKTTKNNNGVIVAHDNRKNGNLFAISISQVLIKNGIKVYFAPNNESVATPVVSYWIKKLSLSGGINVTASHNPPNYNGFKTYNCTGCQTNSLEEEIIMQNIPEIENIFKIEYEKEAVVETLPSDYLTQYFEELKTYLPKIDKPKDFAVLFSSHHGTSSQHMLNFAHELGFKNFQEFVPECNITHLLNENENTNPEEKESFNESKKYAVEQNINYIFAHDPDSDRSAVMEKQSDGSWYSFNGNEMAILFIHFLLSNAKLKEKTYIVSTYVSGNYIKKILQNKGKIYLTKTGFKNISLLVEQYQKTGNLLIAFEEAIGALIFPMNREKDGFQQSSLVLFMLSKYLDENKTLTQVLKDIYEKYGHWVGLTDYYFSNKKNWKEQFQLKIKQLNDHSIINLFGYQIKSIAFNHLSNCTEWIMENDCWIKFRISGTEPKFKIYYNLYGDTHHDIMEKIDQFRKYFATFLNF